MDTTNTAPLTPEKRDRLQQLIASASRVFSSQGYRRTAMADIARDMGVAPGTIYLYAESKEALFLLAVHWHLGQLDLDGPWQLPAPAPQHADMVDLLRAQAAAVLALPRLDAALAASHPTSIEAEVRAIVGEFYDTISRYRRAIRLIEGSARDWPDLAELFYHGLRQDFVDRLCRYISIRSAAGYLETVPSPAAAARLILESIAWFAVHRHGDPAAPLDDEQTLRETVLTMVGRALGPRTPSANSQHRDGSSKLPDEGPLL